MIRSAMSDLPDGAYERVFGNGDKKVDYSEHDSGSITTPKETSISLIDDDGKKINKVTTYHKNKIYKQVKQLREELRGTLCTKSECWNPTDRNVQKMLYNELKNPKTRAYEMAMKAIGADPKDCSTESLRR